MRNSDKIVMYESAEAASFREGISGWVSSSGRFWGNDEHMARYDGSTHKLCECGNVVAKRWIKCEACRAREADEKYAAMPFKPHAGEPLVIFRDDRYFRDVESVYDHMLEVGSTDLQLVICEPQVAPEIYENYAEELLPEDMYLDDVAPELSRRIAELNDYIASEKPILSWTGGKFRTSITPPEDVIAELAKRDAEKPACPICAAAFEPEALCATDIELGMCHAACLDGAPTVDLDTGEPVDGPIATYRYGETGAP